MKKDVEASRRLQKKIGAKQKQCFYNAFRAINECEEYGDATYVEGFAVLAVGLVVEHGWIESDGVIIDPTLLDEGMTYFPGLRFNGQYELNKALLLPKPEWSDGKDDLPIFYRFGWGGSNSPDFVAAYKSAYASVGLAV